MQMTATQPMVAPGTTIGTTCYVLTVDLDPEQALLNPPFQTHSNGRHCTLAISQPRINAGMIHYEVCFISYRFTIKVLTQYGRYRASEVPLLDMLRPKA
jgi:hypothetical protein